ncbi:MAG TPA: NAD(P)/FAD-dependent oxidoreductase [Mycobacteriales bacterium]
MAKAPAQILVVGGGYVGMYTAIRLQKKLRLRQGEATVTVVDPQSYMTYQPFLPECAAGSLEPRHVVVPLRRVLGRCRVITGTVERIDPNTGTAKICPVEGPAYELHYDHVVVAPGSISRLLPVPGLAEHGIGFKTAAEAVYLRNYVLSRLDAAASSVDKAVQDRALTFVFVGGGYAGVEAFAELEDMARDVVRNEYKSLRVEQMSWHLVEAAPRILGELSESLADYTTRLLTERGMHVHTGTTLESCEDGHVRLSDGTQAEAETVVWTAGVKAEPILAKYGFELDQKGRLPCAATLLASGFTNVWSAGDCAAVPDLTRPGQTCVPTAQHAVRQAKQLADNIVATLRGKEPASYKHVFAGSVASLGLHKGVAEIYGVKMRGWLAWFMHRTYHVSRVPTFNRKVRVLLDWTVALFFRREAVSLGQFADPKATFRAAAGKDGEVSQSLEAPNTVAE